MEDQKKENCLYVRMFGGFSAEYNGKRLEDNFRENSQIALLLQTFFHFRKKGVERSVLIRVLFGEQEMGDVSHSLRNSLYLAKKKLREIGLPDVEYFRKVKNTYYWTDEIEVIEDAEEFEEAFYHSAVLEKEQGRRFEKMLEAARLYTGPFLPQNHHVPGVAAEAERIRGIFGRCMWEIEVYASGEEQMRQMYEISLHAAQADPFSNWEALAVKTLVAMDQYEEAEKLFTETVAAYVAKFGSRTAKKVRDVVDAMGEHMMYQMEDLSGIQERLRMHGDRSRGGFYCSFPIFQELYRSVERVMDRFGGYIFLLLCTIADGKGRPVEDNERLARYSEKLLESLVRSVRHSDTITRYGKGQFLVLLFGTSEENCSIIMDRIDKDYGKTLAEDADPADSDVKVIYSLNKVIVETSRSFPFFEGVGRKTE